jgi:hypothetical protein
MCKAAGIHHQRLGQRADGRGIGPSARERRSTPANRGYPMNETISTTPPLLAKQALLALICISAASFMLQLDANIVSVSLPMPGCGQRYRSSRRCAIA